jgi:oligopeptidase B
LYTYRFKDLGTGELFEDVIKDVSPYGVWAGDNKTFFYVKQDAQTLRPFQVYRHVLGTDAAKDQLVFEEKDVTFGVSLQKTKSEKYILIGSSQTLTTEYRYLEASDPQGEFRVLQPRIRGHEYHPNHYGDAFYVRTNSGNSPNFRLMKTAAGKTEMPNWQEVIGHRADTFIDDFDIFRDYLVVTERRNALTHLRVRPWSGGAEHYVNFGEPAYAARPTANFEFNTDVLRFNYSSLTTPNSVYDYNMKNKAKTLLKRDEVLGGFDPNNYVTERVSAPSHDGVKIPVSLVYRKGTPRNGTAPLFQYAYGSYGLSMDPRFNPFAVSLLDRGFVYAIAHIRGGQEMGRQWYEDGKMNKKKNTFRDFIAVSEYLIASKYADPKRVFAGGGSAGGLLIGAVMNMRPDLYKGLIAAVPFVDVVTTMLDDTIPLTTSEYDEWGNPNEQPSYEYMLSYSPYDQLEKKAYPNLLVTSGLHDSQVQYWEPAKWVAKQRTLRTDKNRLLLYTNMEAGHGGASAREKRYEETALEYAFVLDLAGLSTQ